jgi:uncharacterized membrane protein
VAFNASMIKVDFFRDYYNVVAPLLILLLAILFGALGVFKYNSKTLEAVVLFNLKRESTSDNKPGRVAKQFQVNQTFLERVLLGEKAILKEYDSIKTKFERKRFSTFGFNLGGETKMGSFGNNESTALKK